MPLFIRLMIPILQEMLDEVCELAKQEMKEVDGDELGSWTSSNSCRWGVARVAAIAKMLHSASTTLYYMHICQKGRDKIIKDKFYKGTSKSAEGYAARHISKKLKRRGCKLPSTGKMQTPPLRMLYVNSFRCPRNDQWRSFQLFSP